MDDIVDEGKRSSWMVLNWQKLKIIVAQKDQAKNLRRLIYYSKKFAEGEK